MRSTLLDILACPECRCNLSLETPAASSEDPILEGTLRCEGCGREFPIRSGIPRFVQFHPADASFGFQWNLFRREQLDSENDARLSATRLWTETQWDQAELAGQRVLDVGCGAGRFLEIITTTKADVVGVDVSTAIDAAAATVAGRPNVDLVQADVFKLPFKPGTFDKCYCIGVAQHTPDPIAALGALPRLLRKGGRIAVTVYERRPWTLLNGKYLIRPITKRLNKSVLLAMIKGTMPILFPLTEILFRLPLVGRPISFVLPVANYVSLTGLTFQQRYRLAVLDTFDRLAPAYDLPLTEDEVKKALVGGGVVEITRLRNSGVNLVGSRAEHPAS
jgi:ubiquinone/menaquinone biosynthesis C-methylase UbiE/uncharacterized protein YbaR (Trm112 family)